MDGCELLATALYLVVVACMCFFVALVLGLLA
jgi:hypothetical protein